MSKSRSRILTIGVMSFAHTHVEGVLSILSQRDDVRVISSDPGVHLDDEVRGRALADQFDVDYVDSYEELFARGVDAVVIASENNKHRELSVLAAQHGVHILCEKPLATSREDADQIELAVEAAGIIHMTAYPVRFSTEFARLKHSFNAGQLGTLISVRGTNNGKLPTERAWFSHQESAGGGALIDHVVHIADMLDDLLSAQAISVTAVSNTILHADRSNVETAGLVIIRYDSGLIASIDCSWSVPDRAPKWGGLTMTLAGTSGTVDIDFFRPSVRGIRSEDGRGIEIPYGPDSTITLIDQFITAVRSGSNPGPDTHSARRSLEIALAASESARTGATVTLVAQ